MRIIIVNEKKDNKEMKKLSSSIVALIKIFKPMSQKVSLKSENQKENFCKFFNKAIKNNYGNNNL